MGASRVSTSRVMMKSQAKVCIRMHVYRGGKGCDGSIHQHRSMLDGCAHNEPMNNPREGLREG